MARKACQKFGVTRWCQKIIASFFRLKKDDRVVCVVAGGASGFFDASSTTAAAPLAMPRRRWRRLGGGGGGGSSAFSDSRWPSKIAVSQGRLFSVRTAQILAAAPASFSGPATRRSCMPSPLVLSLMTMIGRNAASGAFDLDFNSPRHSMRRPFTELAVPRSTPNSVRRSETFGARHRRLPRRSPMAPTPRRQGSGSR